MRKKVSLIQMDVKVGAIKQNFKKIKKLLNKAILEKPDIIVFPEMINTGFIPEKNLKKLSDINGLKTKEIFGKFAKKHSVNIVAGSVATVKEGEIFNTSYVFDRRGKIVCEYDKIHSFSPAGEDKKIVAGNTIVNFKLDGIQCSVIVCYDLRFCELTRVMALKGLELLFVVAQWPLKRNEHWIVLNRARAIENQMYVCAVNGCGKIKKKLHYGGNSLLVNPLGKELIHLCTKEQIQSAFIDIKIIKKIRNSMNIFMDRREDIYSLK